MSGGVHLNNTSYIIFIVIFILLISQQRTMNTVIQKKITRKRRKENKKEMVDLAKRFIDKDCIIRTFNNYTFTGLIKEVSESAVLVENGNNTEAINLEYVVSIKEYPRNKKGKKKAIVV